MRQEYNELSKNLDKLYLRQIIENIDNLLKIIQSNKIFDQTYSGFYSNYLDRDDMDLFDIVPKTTSNERKFSIISIAENISNIFSKLSRLDGSIFFTYKENINYTYKLMHEDWYVTLRPKELGFKLMYNQLFCIALNAPKMLMEGKISQNLYDKIKLELERQNKQKTINFSEEEKLKIVKFLLQNNYPINKMPWSYLDIFGKWISSFNSRDELKKVADLLSISLPKIKNGLDLILRNEQNGIYSQYGIEEHIDPFLNQQYFEEIITHLSNVEDIDITSHIGRASLFAITTQVGELSNNFLSDIKLIHNKVFKIIIELRNSVHLIDDNNDFGTGRNLINFIHDPDFYANQLEIEKKNYAREFFTKFKNTLVIYKNFINHLRSNQLLEAEAINKDGSLEKIEDLDNVLRSNNCYGNPLGTNSEISINLSISDTDKENILKNSKTTRIISIIQESINKLRAISTSNNFGIQDKYAVMFYLSIIGQSEKAIHSIGGAYDKFTNFELDMMFDCLRHLRNSLMHQHEFNPQAYILEYFSNPLITSSFLHQIDHHMDGISAFLDYFLQNLIPLKETLQKNHLGIAQQNTRITSEQDFYNYILAKQLSISLSDKNIDELKIILRKYKIYTNLWKEEKVLAKSEEILKNQGFIELSSIIDKQEEIMNLCNAKGIITEGLIGRIKHFGYAKSQDSSGIVVSFENRIALEDQSSVLREFKKNLNEILQYKLTVVTIQQLEIFLQSKHLSQTEIATFIQATRDDFNLNKLANSINLYNLLISDIDNVENLVREFILNNLQNINYGFILGPKRSDPILFLIKEMLGVDFVCNDILQHVNINPQNKYGTRLLYILAMDGSYDDLAKLLNVMPELNLDYEESSGATALDEAIKLHKNDIAKLLIDRRAECGMRVDQNSALHEAASYGNYEIIDHMLTKYPNLDVNQLDKNGFLPIHRALEVIKNTKAASYYYLEGRTTGWAERQSNFIKFFSDNIIKFNARNIIKLLILKGSRGEQIEYDHDISPIYWTYYNIPELFTTLISNTENFYYIHEATFPIHLATERAGLDQVHRDAFNHIIKHSHSLNVQKDYEYPALAIAIRAKNFESVRSLVEAGANIDYDNGSHDDLKYTSIEIVTYLVGKGRPLNFQEFFNELDQQSDLKSFIGNCINMIKAVKDNDISAVKMYESNGIPLTLRFWTEKQWCKEIKTFGLGDQAIKKRSADIINYFLDEQIISQDDLPKKKLTSINLDEINSEFEHYTQYEQTKKIVKGICSGDLSLLKKAKAEDISSDVIYIYKGMQGTILHFAIQKNSKDAVKLILEKWPFLVNHPDKLYESVPLITAIKGKNEDIITLVREQTIKEHNFFPSNARSVLKEQALYRHTDTLEQIFASLTESDKNRINQEVIFINFIDDKNEIAEIAVNMLLKYGVDINYQGHEGNTALHYACKYNELKIAKILIADTNINLNIINNASLTPLHLAAQNGRLEIAETLLSHYSTEINSYVDHFIYYFTTGLTNALDLALESNQYRFAKMLVEKGIVIGRNTARLIVYALKNDDPGFIDTINQYSQILDIEEFSSFFSSWQSNDFSQEDYNNIAKSLQENSVRNKIPEHMYKTICKFIEQKTERKQPVQNSIHEENSEQSGDEELERLDGTRDYGDNHSTETDSDQNSQDGAGNSDNSSASLCIDASIYDSNYHKLFEKLASNLQFIGDEISHNVISIGYYIIDNIYDKNDNSNNNQATLMIEDEPYTNCQSKTKTSINFNALLYKSTISFKSLDFMVDTFRFINEPSVENAQKALRDVIHLQNILGGTNMYSMALSFIDITNQLSKGEIQEAGVQAITTISYMAIPTMLSFTGIPYLGFAYGSLMAGYSGYHAINNAYSLYSEYGTVEWQLKSSIAYTGLYKALANSPFQYTYDFSSNAKWYEIKANSIKLEIEKSQTKQHLEVKGEFGNKLYDYIYAPTLEEKYNLLNKVISGELTEEQAAALKAKHVSMTISEQYYKHCMEIKNVENESNDEQYYCYNEEQQILNHIAITGTGYAGYI